MNAFDRAWALLKMPLYHGTPDKDSVLEEGLKAKWGREVPDLDENVATMLQDGYTREQIKQHFLNSKNENCPAGTNFDEYDWETMMEGDNWLFAEGDNHVESMNRPGGKDGAIDIAHNGYGMGGGVFEIDDKHPDSPEWIRDPKFERYSGEWESRYENSAGERNWRTNEDVPPQTMRLLSREEIDESQARVAGWKEAFQERRDLLESLMYSWHLDSSSKEEKNDALRQWRTMDWLGRVKMSREEYSDKMRGKGYLHEEDLMNGGV